MGWGAPPLQREGGAFTCCFRGVLGLLGAGGGPLFREKGGRFTGSFRAHPAPPLGADRGPLTFRSAERGFTCSPLDVPGSGMPSFREGRGPTSAHPGDARSPPSPSPGLAESGGAGRQGPPASRPLRTPRPTPPRAPPTAAGRARHSRDRPRAAPGAAWRAGPSSPCCSACSARWCPPRVSDWGRPGVRRRGGPRGARGAGDACLGARCGRGACLERAAETGGASVGAASGGGHVQWVGGTSGGTPGPPSPPGRNALCPRAANAPGRRLRSFCQLSSWACWNSALVGRLTA